MLVHSYNQNGYYTGEVDAYLDPEEGGYILPINSTDIPLIQCKEGFSPQFDGYSWHCSIDEELLAQRLSMELEWLSKEFIYIRDNIELLEDKDKKRCTGTIKQWREYRCVLRDYKDSLIKGDAPSRPNYK